MHNTDLYLSLLDTVNDLIQSIAPDGSFVFVNRAWRQTLGYTQEEMAQLKFDQVIHPQYRTHCLELFDRVMGGEAVGSIEVAFIGKDGQPVYLEGNSRRVIHEGHWVTQSIFRDISQRKLLESVLWQSEQELGTILENIPDSIVRLARDQRVVYANPNVERTIGIAPAQMVGKRVGELGLPQDVYVPLVEAVNQVFESAQPETWEGYYATPVGIQYFHARMMPELASNGLVESVLVISRDITERKQLEEKLRDLSISDELTGLLNRRGFLVHAEQQLKLTKGQRTHGSWLVFADLNGLKQVNDTFGHAEGDWAIAKCAELLRHSFRGSDIVARLGGDEFVALVLETSQTDKDAILSRLHQNIEHCNQNSQKPYQISLSIGSSHIAADHTAELEALIAQADQAMYREKRGRGAQRV